jgi:hypothetical protein
MAVAWSEISLAFDFLGSGDPGGQSVFLRRETGELFWHSDIGDDDLPDDIDDGEKYVALPDPRDLDLGKRLAMRFASEHLDDHYDKVVEIFSRRGAYRRFKDLLEREGALDRWHSYEEAAQEKALREWCAENGIELEG